MRTPTWKRPLLLFTILAIAAGAVGAVPRRMQSQGGPVRIGVGGKVLLENDWVKVVEGGIAAGEAAGLHRHNLATVVVVLEGATIEETLHTGGTATFDRKPGDVIWRDAGLQRDEFNLGRTRLRVIAVQLK